MISLDILGGILLVAQITIYNRILPFFTLYVLGADFNPPLIKPLIYLLYIFNMLMLASSTAKVYSTIRSTDENEKRYHNSMTVAGIVVVLLFNLVAEILLTKFRAL